MLALFTETANYSHGTRKSVGRSEIAKVFTRRSEGGPRTARHLYSGLQLQIHSANSASGTSVCMTFACNGEAPIVPATPYLVADFIDQYERGSDGIWRISARHIERIFVADSNTGPVGQAADNTRGS